LHTKSPFPTAVTTTLYSDETNRSRMAKLHKVRGYLEAELVHDFVLVEAHSSDWP